MPPDTRHCCHSCLSRRLFGIRCNQLPNFSILIYGIKGFWRFNIHFHFQTNLKSSQWLFSLLVIISFIKHPWQLHYKSLPPQNKWHNILFSKSRQTRISLCTLILSSMMVFFNFLSSVSAILHWSSHWKNRKSYPWFFCPRRILPQATNYGRNRLCLKSLTRNPTSRNRDFVTC